MDSGERFLFTSGKNTNAAVTQQLEQATGIVGQDLREKIPELNRDNLAFEARWHSDGYDTSHPIGRANAEATKPFIVVVVGNPDGYEPDMSGVNRSHIVNSVTGEVQSFEGFYGALGHLLDNFGTTSMPDSNSTS